MNLDITFPEHDFPPSREFRADYERRVELGRQRMSQSSVVICGLARDVADVLLHTTARIERLGAMFSDYRVVIYENDSRDDTKPLLIAWSRRNPRVNATLECRGDPINPNARCLKRATRMARYRNHCLDTVRTHFSHFDYAIVVDTDLAGGWSFDGIANSLGHDAWDYIGSNGIIIKRVGLRLNVTIQYDAWAFRLDEAFTPFTTQQVNSMSWTRGEPLVPVTCSFGGLGLFRMSAYLAGDYSGDDVDHVTHQRRARANGFTRVFLNPSQVVLYGRRQRSLDPVLFPSLKFLTRLPGLRHWQTLVRPDFSPIAQPLG